MTSPGDSTRRSGIPPPRVRRIRRIGSPAARAPRRYAPTPTPRRGDRRTPTTPGSAAPCGRSGTSPSSACRGTSRPAADTDWRRRPPRRRCVPSRPRPAGTAAEGRSPPPVAAIARRPEYVGAPTTEGRLHRHVRVHPSGLRRWPYDHRRGGIAIGRGIGAADVRHPSEGHRPERHVQGARHRAGRGSAVDDRARRTRQGRHQRRHPRRPAGVDERSADRRTGAVARTQGTAAAARRPGSGSGPGLGLRLATAAVLVLFGIAVGWGLYGNTSSPLSFQTDPGAKSRRHPRQGAHAAAAAAVARRHQRVCSSRCARSSATPSASSSTSAATYAYLRIPDPRDGRRTLQYMLPRRLGATLRRSRPPTPTPA